MGVTVLQAYPVPQDQTAPQVIEVLQKRIVNLGANLTGQYLVDCDTYFSAQGLNVASSGGTGSQPRVLHVLHNSEHPATVFSVVEPHSNKPRVTFTSDTLFDLLLLKLSNFYSKKLKIEAKGPRFEIGDFVVKLGVVSVGASVKGILVEVDYLPCIVVQSCWDLLREFMQGFLGSVVPGPLPSYLLQKGTDLYSPLDTAHQYLDHFALFRKAGGSIIDSQAPGGGSGSSGSTPNNR